MVLFRCGVVSILSYSQIAREEMSSTATISLDRTPFDDNDDFEVPLTQTTTTFNTLTNSDSHRPSKKPKHKTTAFGGIDKENVPPYYHYSPSPTRSDGYYEIENCSLDFIPSTLDSDGNVQLQTVPSPASEPKVKGAYSHNSIESKLVASRTNALSFAEADSELNLCDELDSSVQCPLCGVDISNLTEEQRHLHTNHCLDKGQDVRYTPFLHQW